MQSGTHVSAALVLILVVFHAGAADPGYWREQCSFIGGLHTVSASDTASTLMQQHYPTADWRVMWSLVMLCNSNSDTAAASAVVPATATGEDEMVQLLPAVAAFNPGPAGDLPLAVLAGSILKLPVFQVPINEERRAAAAAAAAASSQQQQQQQQLLAAAVPGLCACEQQRRFKVQRPSSWLQLAAALHPATDGMAAAALLAVCNPQATATQQQLVAAGQWVWDIDTQTPEAHQPSTATGLQEPIIASAPQGSGEPGPSSNSICSVQFVPETGPVRSALLSAGCPWYADGCSGPSDILAFQQELTPCCNAHDYCYYCAWRVVTDPATGLGTAGRELCDTQMLDNMRTACDYHFAPRGWWDAAAVWNRGWCQTTAGIMFTAVDLWQRAKGGSLGSTQECPGDSWKLARAGFCFARA